MKIPITIPIKRSIKMLITIKTKKKSCKVWIYQVPKIRKEKKKKEKLIPIDCKKFEGVGIYRDKKEKKLEQTGRK